MTNPTYALILSLALSSVPAFAVECASFPLPQQLSQEVIKPEGARGWQMDTYCLRIQGAIDRILTLARAKNLQIQGTAGDYLNRPTWDATWPIKNHHLGDGELSGGSGMLNRGFSISLPGTVVLGTDSVPVQMSVFVSFGIIYEATPIEQIVGREAGFDALGRPTPATPDQTKYQVKSRVDTTAAIIIENANTEQTILDTLSSKLADEELRDGMTDILDVERRIKVREARQRAFSQERNDFPTFEIIK